MTGVMESLRGGVIVSCQAYPGEPMRTPDTMARVAQAAAAGGAVGIRAQGLDDLRSVRTALDLPLIGLWKDGDAGVVITPTLRHALEVARAGADIVALDATNRPRTDGSTVEEVVRAVHEETQALVMADVATYDEGVAAENAGADLVGTTLAGYTSGSEPPTGPDLGLVRRLASTLRVPVVAEGRIHRPEQVATAFREGAYAVVVGTAITHPTTLTRWFVDATVPSDEDS
ncbi:N-acetylmannosamine-6-phosphate 2-epimerase [Haloactinomyces albus]|uniref:Putative N-acetylmannosamine-6-phosphate 2-epimerase n=1 Tax=Haloactinomyces albus TaxID=1352928 RepID=A0AAE4CNJ9_9ACTN|nr:N-acetylmannosamine-6-phosphate 2-epimerase [Haloactinomyces albus]MDR7303551.1 N-acylglucosamine-6-phosphate 2-epimerase [Haloactinomyces albus]